MWEKIKDLFHINELSAYFTMANLKKVIFGVVSVFVFYIIYRVIKAIVKKQTAKKLEKHASVMISKMISYVFYVAIAMYILGLLGISLKAIFGAVGIAGLAIGFAAQTSVSNLISGMFVLGERAIRIDDFIEVDGVSGTVDGIGLLSVRIHTSDNQMVRIPNSRIINSNLTNYSHFDLRRFMFEIPISYSADLQKVIAVIKTVPDLCPTVLKTPAPTVFYDGFKEAISLKLTVWFKKDDFIQTKNDVYMNIVKVCGENGIEIPYEHIDITLLNSNNCQKDAIC